jgi:hypothetical protein
MEMTARTRSLPMLLAGTLVALAIPLPGRAGVDGFVFLRNARNTTARVSKADVRALFTGKTKNWAGGEVVQVIISAEGSPEMTWLSERVLGVTEAALRSKMKYEAFKGELRTPLVVSSVSACIAELKSNPGGTCAADAVSATNLPSGILTITYAGN